MRNFCFFSIKARVFDGLGLGVMVRFSRYDTFTVIVGPFGLTLDFH